MGDTSKAADFLAGIERDRRQRVEEVEASAKAFEESRQRYETAVLKAHRAGITNTSIAIAANRTEAAIRLFIKRKKMVGR